ncbi:hypothetical protein PS15m_007069 [Mucor circinelloides]
MLAHGQLYVSMSRVRKATDLYFFGAAAPLPLEALRKYGVDVEAINISRRIMGDNDQDDEEADDE